jgi:hypothetical protein
VDVFRDMYEDLHRDHVKLWESVGEMMAQANPEGMIATRFGHTAEQRLDEIWKILQSLKP